MFHVRGTVASLVALVAVAACSAPKESAPAKPAPAPDPFRQTFDVDRAALGPDGVAPYASLVPGTVHVLESHDETVTITVLDETRLVDGVTTRVVEEREEEDGQLKEVSRNFFAMDRGTGDLYYFGEEVDLYEKGAISGHGGAWLAGASGARFGLLLPGHPKVGDRYYQEVAPGVAMDRAQVVALDERVETPAGVFEHCLYVLETTPLEKGTSHKWYAPGIGMIRDDDCVLTQR